MSLLLTPTVCRALQVAIGGAQLLVSPGSRAPVLNVLSAGVGNITASVPALNLSSEYPGVVYASCAQAGVPCVRVCVWRNHLTLTCRAGIRARGSPGMWASLGTVCWSGGSRREPPATVCAQTVAADGPAPQADGRKSHKAQVPRCEMPPRQMLAVTRCHCTCITVCDEAGGSCIRLFGPRAAPYPFGVEQQYGEYNPWWVGPTATWRNVTGYIESGNGFFGGPVSNANLSSGLGSFGEGSGYLTTVSKCFFK